MAECGAAAGWIDFNVRWTAFCDRGLNEPGTLVEVSAAGEGVARYLIGDINRLAGVCDDCPAFRDNAIVLRYRVVWTPGG